MNLIETRTCPQTISPGRHGRHAGYPSGQAQSEPLAPIDLLSCLVSDELARRGERLLERRKKQAQFRDSQKSLDNFDFNFNKKMNRSLILDLATGAFIARHEDALFLGPPGSGKSHLAQAIGQSDIQQGYRVLHRETHTLLDDLADATLDGTRKEHMEFLVTVPLLIIDDLGMRTAAARRRGSAGDHHAAIRARQYHADLQSPGGRLGQTAGRRGRGQCYARSTTAPRAFAQVRPAELENQNRLASTGWQGSTAVRIIPAVTEHFSLSEEVLMQAATQDRILGLASGEGEAFWWFNGLATLKVTGEQSGGLFSLIETMYPAGGTVPRHVHHREDELFYLIDGELEMRIGERTIQAKPGTTLYAPRDIPHGFQVGPKGPVHYLILYTPAGFEGFIRDTSRPARSLTLPPPPDEPPTPAQMEAIGEMMRQRYGCEWA